MTAVCHYLLLWVSVMMVMTRIMMCLVGAKKHMEWSVDWLRCGIQESVGNKL